MGGAGEEEWEGQGRRNGRGRGGELGGVGEGQGRWKIGGEVCQSKHLGMDGRVGVFTALFTYVVFCEYNPIVIQ